MMLLHVEASFEFCLGSLRLLDLQFQVLEPLLRFLFFLQPESCCFFMSVGVRFIGRRRSTLQSDSWRGCVCALNFQAMMRTVLLSGSSWRSARNLTTPSFPIFSLFSLYLQQTFQRLLMSRMINDNDTCCTKIQAPSRQLLSVDESVKQCTCGDPIWIFFVLKRQ